MAVFALTGIELGPDNQFVTSIKFAETVAAGKGIFINSAGEGALADASDTAKRRLAGVTIQAVTAGNYGAVVTSGKIRVTNALTVADGFILATGGDFQLYSDIAAGQFLTSFGAASLANEIEIALQAYDVQRA